MPHTYLHTYTTTAQLCPPGSPDKNATDVTAQRSHCFYRVARFCFSVLKLTSGLGSTDPQLYTKLRTVSSLSASHISSIYAISGSRSGSKHVGQRIHRR